ncbi:MAG: glucose-6-phosphate isomerase, partial [Clostridia bacterium]
IAEMLAGAREMDERCKTADTAKNPALLEAGLMFLSMKWGANISVMMPYADSLKLMSDWYAQLWAESLGKNVTLTGERVNVGQTPVKTLGVTDQHSQLQLYTEGPYDKVLTFLKVEHFRAETKIPHGIDDIDTIAFLGGKTHNQLIEAERRGTEYALYRSGRMSQTITLDEVNANTVGQLLYFFELVTAYTGALLGIDTFNQPGVEESKVAAYAVMGFESEKHNLKREEMKTKPAPKDRYILG